MKRTLCVAGRLFYCFKFGSVPCQLEIIRQNFFNFSLVLRAHFVMSYYQSKPREPTLEYILNRVVNYATDPAHIKYALGDYHFTHFPLTATSSSSSFEKGDEQSSPSSTSLKKEESKREAAVAKAKAAAAAAAAVVAVEPKAPLAGPSAKLAQGVRQQYLRAKVPIAHTIRGHQRAPSGSREFKELTKRDAQVQLQQDLNRLLMTASEANRPLAQRQLAGFAGLFERFLQEEGPSVIWENIEPLPEKSVKDYSTLTIPSIDTIHEMLGKLVVVKLNGGLGTSMGCHGPKSVIPVRSDLTFLDLTVQQIEHLNKTYKANVPLVLMNSFNTDEDTQKIIRKYKGLQVEIYTFNQSCYPRINRDSLLPVPKTCNIGDNMEAWYPPGHGDFYCSFQESGLLSRFLEEGRQYCFISNIDNLGATVDLNILDLLLNPNAGDATPEFVMEVTDKTRADVKGGTLIQYEGKLRLLEIAQVPREHIDDFKSVKTFKFFNTNNLWAKLDAIDRILNANTLNMEVIVNNKTLDSGINIIQLETAVGAAMKCFEGGIGINVPRSRFLPVKKTSDLLLVMSNLYNLQNGSLVMSPERMFPTTPFVKLGDNHFSKVKEFLARFANIPDLMELDHLTVSGDVTFGRDISLKGTVIIIANHGDRIDIPSGSVLENKIVSGNMRILDH